MAQVNLPFKVGQIIEVKAFEDGYNGAWFRCKILDTITEEGELSYKLKYLDYPEEAIHATKVIQNREGEEEKHIMVRPKYPPRYHESEQPKIKLDQELLLVTHDDWKVGDLVDWWFDDCYWCGTVLELKRNGAVQVALLPKPFGEGGSYRALSKDLRPSLEWSPEDGWKVPFSTDGQKRQCAKVVKKHKNEDQVNADVCETGKEQTKRVMPQRTDRAKRQKTERVMQQQTERVTQQQTERATHKKTEIVTQQKTGSVTQQQTERATRQKTESVTPQKRESVTLQKRERVTPHKTERATQQLKGDEGLVLNIMKSDSIEAVVLDLEEMIVRIEWLQGILRQDDHEDEKSYWKFEDHRPSSSKM